MEKKSKRGRHKIDDRGSAASPADIGDGENPYVAAGLWKDEFRKTRRTFPGPKGASAHLRVAFEQEAYSELVSHAKEELENEVCGVLVGDVCNDDGGDFVHVRAVIRGDAARKGRAHVTFTQDTWTKIHEALEERYRRLRIVGWYHSHPGFGVTFSDMDAFIHQNFFPSSTHVAFITDPLGGEEALCVNAEGRMKYVECFWVGGRQRRCMAGEVSGATGVAGPPGVTGRKIEDLETRVAQLMGIVEELRMTVTRFVMGVGIFLMLGFVLLIGYHIYTRFAGRYEPPKVQSFVPVPVRIEGKDVLLGVEVKKWELPPELTTQYHMQQELLLRQREEAAKQARELAGDGESAASAADGVHTEERESSTTRDSAGNAAPERGP